MIKKILSIGLVISTLFLIGCAHNISAYNPSLTNIHHLQRSSKGLKPITLTDFSDVQQIRSITCRAEGTETLPNGMTYASYIKQALQAELSAAHLFKADAKTTLSARLDKVDFSSAIGGGDWYITMTFNDHHQKPYTVSSKYNFSANFIADIACTEVANAFVPAVQKFLSTLYANSHFKRTLKGYR